MFNLNKVQLIGNIGEIKINETDDKKMAVVSVATNETWKDADGNKQERATWHRCVVWQKHTVEFIEKYLAKGRFVYVEGSLRSREYEADGETKYVTEITVDELSPLDPKPENAA